MYCGNNPIIFIDPRGLKDVPLREFIEERGGNVTWDAYSKAAIVDFGSAGSKIYWAGPQKTRSDDSSSSERPYLKYDVVDGEVTLRLYVNDKDIINDFGIRDYEMRNTPELGNITFTLFYKDKKYYQRLAINGKEYLYENVKYKNFDFYTAGGKGRYKIGYSRVTDNDIRNVNQEWKDLLRDAIDVLSSDATFSSGTNFVFSIISIYTSEYMYSDSILSSRDYAIRFRNRNYYIDGPTKELKAYTKYTR